MSRDAVDDLSDLDEATVDAIRAAVDHQERRELQRLQLRRLVDLRSREEIDDAPDRLSPELAALRVEMPVKSLLLAP